MLRLLEPRHVPKRLAREPSDVTAAFVRIEELIVASSGADVFEETLKLVANDEIDSQLDPRVRQQCAALLQPFRGDHEAAALDALFETLVTRTSKGQKGQFFTPRYVVDFCLRLVELRGGETVLDPACGSGAFLSAALRAGAGKVDGYDIDERAVRIAGLLVRTNTADGATIRVGDGLRDVPDESADIVLSNPPFAGEMADEGLLATYELAAGRATIERDVLFLERCLRALRPGGKMAIVLPHNKFSGKATRYIREWLLARADILAIVGLGRNTFLPHTHQKANVLLARRPIAPRNGKPPRIFFAQSVKDGKDTRGRATGAHDLDVILQGYRTSSHRKTELDADLTLAPERNGPPARAPQDAVGIGELAAMQHSYCRPTEAGTFVVVDTSHASDGFIAMRPLEQICSLKSNKKRLEPGDVIVSRLRPYLRQIGYADQALFEQFKGAQLCCSTEFYVFRAPPGATAAFLVPFFLSKTVQTVLAQSQEGGHHPRVPATVIATLCVPPTLVRDRESISIEFLDALASFRKAERARQLLVCRSD